MKKPIVMQYAHDQMEQPTINKRQRELSASEKCLISGGSGAAAVDKHVDVAEVRKMIKGSTLSAGGGSSVVVVEGEPIIKPIPYT